MKRTLQVCILIALSCLLIVPNMVADDVHYGVTFQAVNQSRWTSGPAAYFDKTYFLGKAWNETGIVGPGVGCYWIFGCWGGWVGGQTWGKGGLELYVHADAGSINAAFPANIGLNLPHVITAGDTIQINSVLDLKPGSLETAFPNAEIVGWMVLDVHAKLGGQVCVYDCAGGWSADLINLNIHPELFSYNKDDNGKLALLGMDLPYNFGQTQDFYGGEYQGHLGDITVNTPNLDLIGSADTHQLATGLGASGDVDVVVVHADVLNLGLQAAGLPPLSASLDFGIGSMSASLLEVNVGASVGIGQDFFLYDPKNVGIKLHVEETGEDLYFQAGQAISYTVATQFADQQLHVTPTFTLGPTPFINNTDLLIGPDVNVQALEACFDIFGVGDCLGPLLDYAWPPAGSPIALGINVYDSTFNLNFASVQGETFTLQVQDPVPEPASLVLFVTGAITALSGRLLIHGKKKR